MSNETLVTRRRMLQVTGGSLIVGLAGCSDSSADDSEGDPSSTSADNETDDHNDSESHDDTETHSDEEEEGGHGDEEEEGGHGDEEEEGGHGDDEHGHDGEVGEPTDTAEVKMVTEGGGYHFEPHVVRVNVGGTVTFHNESGSHSSTAYHPDNDQPQLIPNGAASWDSGLLSEQGATFEHTFETEGIYHYYCTPHEAPGMIGSIIVGEPEAHGQPALEEVPQDKPDSVREKLQELNTKVNEALGHTH
ncbi:cupredoxin domain-containing protein [Halovenus sp. HT40]|uniref:cupredoxin domain-containing protein n=1 Tax=Halovenus sp. HT40 TaxID=3126691 RepID=UPI00300ECFA1